MWKMIVLAVMTHIASGQPRMITMHDVEFATEKMCLAAVLDMEGFEEERQGIRIHARCVEVE